jgi:ribonuclease HII
MRRSWLLTESEREQLYVRLPNAPSVSDRLGEPRRNRPLNILEATRLAMHRALAGLDLSRIACSLTRFHCPVGSSCSAPSSGDALCLSVAAASIVAKVMGIG